MHFVWHQKKAEANLRKHKVAFEEVVSVFYDPLSATFRNPGTAGGEERFVTIGHSSRHRLLVVVHTEGQSESSVHVLRRSMNGSGMKTKRAPRVEQLRAEYDFDYSKAERGKYFKRLLKEASNVVVLDRDVAKAFPDSAAVNKALRSVMKSRKPRRASRP